MSTCLSPLDVADRLDNAPRQPSLLSDMRRPDTVTFTDPELREIAEGLRAWSMQQSVPSTEAGATRVLDPLLDGPVNPNE